MVERVKDVVKVCALAGVVAGSAAWAPVPCPGSGSRMMTPWGEKVTPENVLPEYPRPQMVRAQWENLNGIWEYAITPDATMTPSSPWDRFEPCRSIVQRGEILVPFAVETPLSGVGRLLEPTELLWYRRNLAVKKVPGKRLMLNFGAVDFRCQVFIGHDEATVVPHEGGLVPFSVDLTDYVKDGDNELILCVWDPTSKSLGSAGKQVFNPSGCCYTRMSGVWQTVWTEWVPERRIESYRVVTDIDAGTVDIRFAFEGPKTTDEVTVSVEGVGTFKGLDRVTVKMPEGFRLWSPETPNLYNFTAKYGEDEIRGYFGMRKFEKRADANGVLRFFLNNEPYFILGPLDQGWWPDGFLTPPSEAAMEFDIRTIKSLGCNMMRKHMKDEPARYYYLCDKIGVIVVQDMAAGGGDRTKRYGFYRRELKEMVDYLYSFPSIVMWVPFNENWDCQPGPFFTHNALDWIRRYDPTRLIDGPSGWEDYEGGHCRRGHRPTDGTLTFAHKPPEQCEAADTVDMHIYRGPGMFPVNPRRVSFLGEFGGLGQSVEGHVWSPKAGSWGYGGTRDTQTKDALTNVYLGLMDKLANLAFKGLGGAVYTQTTDVELEINGYLTYDRKVMKFDVERVAAAHRRVLEMARLGASRRMKSARLFEKNDANPKAWAYTIEAPADSWMDAAFDDAAWKRSAGGFGNEMIVKDHAAAKVATTWDTSEIWLRRHFTYKADGRKPLLACLEMFHDEDVVVYLNGKQILSRSGYTTGYEPFVIPGEAFAAAVREGDNVLAVRVIQRVGGQYFDAGLSVETAE